MAQIQQIQIKFAAVEDRLLMRVSGGNETEFRFWLTHRFVRLIWPVLGQALRETPRIKTQVSPVAKQEILAFEHQKAMSKADFQTPYQETPKALPLGEAPILLAKMQMRRQEDGTVVLALAPETGTGIDLALNSELLHSLTELLANAAKLAEWELPALIADTATAPPPDGMTVN